MLVPAMLSTGMWCSSNHWRTPISLMARAPPPASASPMRGLPTGPGGGGAGVVEEMDVAEPLADLLAPPCSPLRPAAGLVAAGDWHRDGDEVRNIESRIALIRPTYRCRAERRRGVVCDEQISGNEILVSKGTRAHGKRRR